MSFQVLIGNTGETYACDAAQTLLAGMEALRRRGIPVGCRGGGCGVCKVRVDRGAWRASKMSRAVLPIEEEEGGFVLACRAYPRGDLVVTAVDKLARCIERADRGDGTWR